MLLVRKIWIQFNDTIPRNMYRLHHEVEVGMGFTQPRAEGPRIV